MVQFKIFLKGVYMISAEVFYFSNFLWLLVTCFIFYINNKNLNRIHRLEMDLIDREIKNNLGRLK